MLTVFPVVTGNTVSMESVAGAGSVPAATSAATRCWRRTGPGAG